MLAPAGVLKFVDEQVANAICDRECCIAGEGTFAFEDMQGNLGHFNEVNGARLGKDGAQFARRVAQKREGGLHDLPILFGITGRRKFANCCECLFQAVNLIERLNQTRMAQLFNFAISRKSLALVDPLAERAIFDE